MKKRSPLLKALAVFLVLALAWSLRANVNYRAEHPPLAKILFGAAIAGDQAEP